MLSVWMAASVGTKVPACWTAAVRVPTASRERSVRAVSVAEAENLSTVEQRSAVLIVRLVYEGSHHGLTVRLVHEGSHHVLTVSLVYDGSHHGLHSKQ